MSLHRDQTQEEGATGGKPCTSAATSLTEASDMNFLEPDASYRPTSITDGAAGCRQPYSDVSAMQDKCNPNTSSVRVTRHQVRMLPSIRACAASTSGAGCWAHQSPPRLLGRAFAQWRALGCALRQALNRRLSPSGAALANTVHSRQPRHLLRDRRLRHGSPPGSGLSECAASASSYAASQGQPAQY